MRGENEARRNEGAYSAPKLHDKVKILHDDEKTKRRDNNGKIAAVRKGGMAGSLCKAYGSVYNSFTH